LLFGGLVGRLVVTPLVIPRAKVMEAAPGQSDRIVELRNVSPVFARAVIEQQQSNAPRLAN
jgi:hypothetical protein